MDKKIYITYEELYYAYLCCQKRKRRTRNEQVFEMNDNLKLYHLWEDINNFRYTVGQSITFIVDTPTLREIFAADFIDRIIHHLIINKFLPYFEQEFIDDTYSCRVGKGTLYGIKRCQSKAIQVSANYTIPTYVYKGDLKSYFMSINKNILWNKIDNFLKDVCHLNEDDYTIYSYLIKLVIFNDCTKSCKFKGRKELRYLLPNNKSLFYSDIDCGLPIGNLTSQIFANYFLTEFDKYIQSLPQVLGYGRYVDDFYIFAKSIKDLKYIRNIIKEELTKIGITLHPKKCYIQEIHNGIPFTGTIIKKNRIYVIDRVKKESKQKILARLSIHPTTIYEKKNCESSVNSILGHLGNFNTKKIRRRIIYTYIKKYKRYNISYTVSYTKIKVHL